MPSTDLRGDKCCPKSPNDTNCLLDVYLARPVNFLDFRFGNPLKQIGPSHGELRKKFRL